MRPRNLLAAVLAIASPACLVLAGCGGSAPRITPESRLSEAEFTRGRALAGLHESLALQRQANGSLRATEEEKESLHDALERTEATVRMLHDQAKKAASEKADLEKSLAEAREAEQKVRESYEKLKGLASTSTDELADLRQRAESAIQEKTKLQKENSSFSSQLSAAVKELDSIKEDLTRTRAVVRSLQENTPVHGVSPGEAALRLKISELEKDLAAASAARETAATNAAAASNAAPPATERPAPVSDVAAVTGIIEKRVQAAMQGEFTWDSITWTALGTVAVVCLLGLLVLIGAVRGLRLRHELRNLRACAGTNVAVDDLEQAVDAAAEAPEAPGDDLTPISPAVRPTRAAEERPAIAPKVPSRRSCYIPREDRDFSAIISAPKKKEVVPEHAQEKPKTERIEAKPAKAERRIVAGPPMPARPAEKKPAPPAPAPDLQDEMASTQIISPLHELVDSSKDEEGGDKEILSELKEIINKKFDELMNK